MICAVCGYENLQGVDNCDNCGADLRTVDIPHPGNELEAILVREHLDAVGPAEPVIVPADASVADVVRTMQERDAEAVLVTDGGRLAGIFTERDALMKLGVAPLTGTIGDVMTRDPVVLRAEDSIAVAIHKMAVGGFRHIPIVDGDRPTGVISSAAVFRHLGGILG